MESKEGEYEVKNREWVYRREKEKKEGRAIEGSV